MRVATVLDEHTPLCCRQDEGRHGLVAYLSGLMKKHEAELEAGPDDRKCQCYLVGTATS